MDDLISRKAVIEIVEKNHTHDITLIDGDAYTEGYRDGIKVKESDVLEDLAELPSAEPKRIKGKWVGSDTQCGIACSVCGVAVDNFCHSADYIDLDYEPNYCPNCGSYNGGEIND